MMGSGAVFWILVFLAVASVVMFFGRFFDLRRAQIDYQDFLKGVFNVLDAGNEEEALSICEDTGAPVANIVATAILNRKGSSAVLREAVDAQGRAEIGRLDRRLASLAIIAQISPLLGLLGTVIGFVHTLKGINAVELVSRADLIGSALEALGVAALGLAVSIMTLVFYSALRVRLERTIVQLEAAASQIVGYLVSSHEEART